MKNWNTDTDMEKKTKLSNTYLLQAYSTHHKFYMEWLGIETGTPG
jgi:hypothetical protein